MVSKRQIADLIGTGRVSRPRRFASIAAAVTAWLVLSTAPAAADYTFAGKWGSTGVGAGQFSYPAGVAADAGGNVYVADTFNHRIQKFDANGNYLTKWGVYGPGNGQFDSPAGVATDAGGNVYVADKRNSRIQEFDANGNYLTKWGVHGPGNGQFDSPAGVATDAGGNVYVADTYNHRIQKFDANGAYLTKWGVYGPGNGQFYYPTGVAADAGGNVYVADSGNNRVQKFFEFQPFPPPSPPPPPSSSGESHGGSQGGSQGESQAAAPDTVAPVFSKLAVTHKRFAVAGGKARKARRMTPRGTTFVYAVSEDARVVFTVKRTLVGRKVGRRCKKASRKLRRRPRCALRKVAGTLSDAGRTGGNRKAFSGAGRAFDSATRHVRRTGLAPGRYVAYALAEDASGNRSAVTSVSFKVVR